MINLFKRGKRVLSYYTINGDLRDTPHYLNMLPSPMFEAVPAWFKKAKTSLANLPTGDGANLKACPSFINILKTGFVVKSPSEVMVEGFINDEGKLDAHISTPIKGVFNIHGSQQFTDGFPFPQDKIHMSCKFENPIHFRPNKPVDILFLPCWWDEQNVNVSAVHGLFRLRSTNDITLNINCYFRQPAEGERYVVPYGTPIAHLMFVDCLDVEFKHNQSLFDDDQAKRTMAQQILQMAQGTRRNVAENIKQYLVK